MLAFALSTVALLAATILATMGAMIAFERQEAEKFWGERDPR